jgi:prolyl-tRNA synthetase
MARAGMIRRTAAGVYSYLPLGWRVHEKIAEIVREEMNRIGAIEVFMPVLVPKELLEESGRDKVDVLFYLKDRNRRDFALGFTHEEVVTDIVRSFVGSWKQLPLSLYQIQTKFRDEPRPRGGLIRGREFTMKDSYSFDLDEAGVQKSFSLHRQAYERIFQRCGVEYLVVEADSGAIGGSQSNEFMILAESGEDTVLRCDACGYAANAERAEVGGQEAVLAGPIEWKADEPKSSVVATPGAHTVAQVCEFLGVGEEKIVKTIVCRAGERRVAALVRGDRELNLPKLGRFLGQAAELADPATVVEVSGAPVGFAGPVGLKDCEIVLDAELVGTAGMVVGANQNDAHRVDVEPGVDFRPNAVADIRTAIAGDLCGKPGCQGRYTDAHGIEVGHIFNLGTRYSAMMGAQVQGADGQNRDVVMGCYGLGISRTAAAIVEAHHDENGIVWPSSVAPFEAVILLLNPKDELQRSAAEKVYQELRDAGVDVLLDDRDERPGFKFKDADLIGYPVRVVVGRGAAEGLAEVSLRSVLGVKEEVELAEAIRRVQSVLSKDAESSS